MGGALDRFKQFLRIVADAIAENGVDFLDVAGGNWHFTYDASHRMLLVARERGSPDPHEDHLTWESQEFDGERLEVSAQPRPMSAYVRLDREGTTITLSSETLGVDRLLTLTRTLKPLGA